MTPTTRTPTRTPEERIRAAHQELRDVERARAEAAAEERRRNAKPLPAGLVDPEAAAEAAVAPELRAERDDARAAHATAYAALQAARSIAARHLPDKPDPSGRGARELLGPDLSAMVDQANAAELSARQRMHAAHRAIDAAKASARRRANLAIQEHRRQERTAGQIERAKSQKAARTGALAVPAGWAHMLRGGGKRR